MKESEAKKQEELVKQMFEKILVEHIATSELRDFHRQKFYAELTRLCKMNYIIGSDDAYDIQRESDLKTKKIKV